MLSGESQWVRGMGEMTAQGTLTPHATPFQDSEMAGMELPGFRSVGYLEPQFSLRIPDSMGQPQIS